MGRRMFEHVDYSALPEDIQIQIVKRIKGETEARLNFSPQLTPASGPYAVLCVLPTAPWEVIEAAYKALAFMTHPDRGGAVEDFQRIQIAYETLKTKKKG